MPLIYFLSSTSSAVFCFIWSHFTAVPYSNVALQDSTVGRDAQGHGSFSRHSVKSRGAVFRFGQVCTTFIATLTHQANSEFRKLTGDRKAPLLNTPPGWGARNRTITDARAQHQPSKLSRPLNITQNSLHKEMALASSG